MSEKIATDERDRQPVERGGAPERSAVRASRETTLAECNAADDVTNSSTGSATPQIDEPIEALLHRVESAVARMDGSTAKQRSTNMLAVYRHAIGKWQSQPPSERQRTFMGRLLVEMLVEAQSGTRK
jgi:hypothetical protein